MKITRLETVVVSIPFSHDGPPTGFGGEHWTRLNYLLVRVDTDAGISGWGESFGYNVIAATKAVLDRQVAPLIVGKDAGDISAINAFLQKTLHLFGRGGPATFAISGVDIALWDIAGKAAGLPLCRLLGGSFPGSALAMNAGSDAVGAPVYASFMRYGEPVHVARTCEHARDAGYIGFKLHEITEPAVAAARSAIGDLPLMVDVNCEWDPTDAESMARKLLRYDLAWLEEPIWPPENTRALKRLRDRTGMRVAAGENVANVWGLRELAPCVDYLQPSVTKMGGVTEFVKVAHEAELAGTRLAPHSPYFGPGLLATLQLGAAYRSIAWLEQLFVRLEAPLYPALDRPDRQGRLVLPDGPGLGADPDPLALAKWRVE